MLHATVWATSSVSRLRTWRRARVWKLQAFATFIPDSFKFIQVHSRLLLILTQKAVFVSYSPYPCCVKICSTCASTETGTVCFTHKKLFVMPKFEDLGANGDRRRRKCHNWNRQPWFACSLCNFYGVRWWLSVVYSQAPHLLSVFGQKTSGQFQAKIWTFWGISRGVVLNLSYSPKRHILAWFHVFWTIYLSFCYIAPTCSEASSGWICAKFVLGGSPRGHNQLSEYFIDCFSQGCRFCGDGWN